jgi:hypothetical protein
MSKAKKSLPSKSEKKRAPKMAAVHDKPQPEKFASKLEADLIADALEAAVARVTAGQREKKEIPKGTCDPDSIEIYHQKGEGTYWLAEWNEQTKTKEFNKYKPGRLTERFTYMGMTKAIFKRGIREVDWPLFKADMWHKVDYCGPLAGHRAGKFIDKNGRTFLVTQEARGVWADLPKAEEFVQPRFLMDFFFEGFQAHGEFEHVMHWLALRFASLRRCDFRPGVALMLAGEAESGKSLFQYIVTQ